MSRVRVAIVAVALFAVMSGLVFRLVDVQATPDERIQERVFIPVGVVTVHGPRGAMLDRNGRTIALSLPSATIVADPRFVEDAEATAAVLAEELGMPSDQLLPRLWRDGAFSYLARQVDREVGERIAALGLAGVTVIDEPRREHPNGDCSALAVIGRVNPDHVGMSGLEEAYDDRLSGVAGRIVKEVSIDGATIPGGIQQVVEAQAGSDITVTLDRNIQYQTERLMIEAVSNAMASSGVALVALPATGEIVAMANVARGGDGVVGCTRQNLAATWSYEPGSVFKPVTIAAALGSGTVAEDTAVTVPPAVTIIGHRIEDTPWHDEVEWTPTEILTVSSNVGTIKLAQLVGEERMSDTVRDFGFGVRTALDFKGESGGIVTPLDDWNRLTLPTVAIGQGVAATPLQVLQMYNSIANDGVLVPLRLIADDTLRGEPSAERVRVLDVSIAAALQRMLTLVVQQGTGRRAALPGFHMAGKTGTAWQPCDVGYACVNERNEFAGRHHTATFAGIVSNDDGPVLVVLVVIDRPKSLRVSGGFLSAPVVRQVAEYALRQLRIPAVSDAAPDERLRAKPAPDPETAATTGDGTAAGAAP